MSALRQKQTYAVHWTMSASPPIATAKADFRKRSCQLYPRKRTCAVQRAMSAMGQQRTSKLGWRLTCVLSKSRADPCRSDLEDQQAPWGLAHPAPQVSRALRNSARGRAEKRSLAREPISH